MSVSLLCLVACVNVTVDEGEGVAELPEVDGPYVEFNPNARVIPLPNNLLRDAATGRLAIPEACDETPAETTFRQLILNALDGFGTYRPALQLTFSEAVDPATLDANIKIYRRATGLQIVDPINAIEVPFIAIPSVTVRTAPDCMSEATVTAVTLIPLVPLVGNSTYVVAALNGVTTAAGTPFLPSVTWNLVRQAAAPVIVESGEIVSETTPFDPTVAEEREALLGLDLLWRAHNRALVFLDGTAVLRDDVLLAWEFNTQTTTSPLDSEVEGSLAANLPTAPLANAVSIVPEGLDAPTVLGAQLGAETCALVGCAAVGDIVAAELVAPNYQLPQELFGVTIPGPWPAPLAPPKIADVRVPVLAVVPVTPAPPGGYPTIIFAHGLTQNKSVLFAVGPQLAGLGFASVALDLVNHGDRAIQYRFQAEVGCAGEPVQLAAPQCFAPFFSPDLPTTRDNFRQSALDVLALVKALKSCTGGACASLNVDGAAMGYLGLGLGGLVGGVAVPMTADIKAAVLNTAGVGLIDLFENTESLAIRCGVVDAMIAFGIIPGEVSNFAVNPPTGSCLGQEWKTLPEYLAFSNVARWIVDPGDGVNYAFNYGDGLITDRILIQEVVDDLVIPNSSTATQAALLNLTAQAPDVTTGLPAPPSAVITTDPNVAKWVRYADVPADAGQGFPGNTYTHTSLLTPDVDGDGDPLNNPDGALATVQMQTDAFIYLLQNVPSGN